MPQIGLGTVEANDDELRKSVRVALETGYRAIDTAYVYLNEKAIGDELQDWFSKGKIKREEVFVTTKLPLIGNRSSDVPRFLSRSLEKLKLDYVDLYLIHHPFGLKCLSEDNTLAKDENDVIHYDNNTDIESIWKAMEKEFEAGRAKAIGISNFNKSQIERILQVAKIRPAVLQIEIHCYFPQKKLVEYCNEKNIVVTAYSPLGAPWTEEGKSIEPKLLENPTVLEIAKKHGKTASQVLLRFLIQRNLVVIPKSVTPERIRINLEVTNFKLGDDEMKRLIALDKGRKGRVFHFTSVLTGVEKHKEYPFLADY